MQVNNMVGETCFSKAFDQSPCRWLTWDCPATAYLSTKLLSDLSMPRSTIEHECGFETLGGACWLLKLGLGLGHVRFGWQQKVVRGEFLIL